MLIKYKKWDDTEFENAFESVLDHAMDMAFEQEDAKYEKIPSMTKKERDALPDEAFGIPGERKYPLLVEDNKAKTLELVKKALSFFHFCKMGWRKELAENVWKVIEEMEFDNGDLKITETHAIRKYVDIPVKFLTVKSRAKHKQGFE